MPPKRIILTLASIGMAFAVSGCLGNGGGGGGGGGGPDFDTALDEATSRAPTIDMPTSLQGNYQGQFRVAVNGGAADLVDFDIDPQDLEILGDLDIDVDWTEGQTANPFSGTASNIVANQTGTTNAFEIEGELAVDASLPATISQLNTPAQTIGGFDVPATDTGAFLFHMTGELAYEEQRGDVTMQMGGNFFGPGGNAMVGTAGGGINNVDNPSQQIFDAGIGGTFYLIQQ